MVCHTSFRIAPRRKLDCLTPQANFKICADGGATRLYHAVEGFRNHGDIVRMLTQLDPHDALSQQRLLQIPDEICGDLDSIEPTIREFYSSRDVKTVQKPSQDATDFRNCIDQVRTFERSKAWPAPMDIVALGGLGGRVDQAFSLFHQLLVMAKDGSILLGNTW